MKMVSQLSLDKCFSTFSEFACTSLTNNTITIFIKHTVKVLGLFPDNIQDPYQSVSGISMTISIKI